MKAAAIAAEENGNEAKTGGRQRHEIGPGTNDGMAERDARRRRRRCGRDDADAGRHLADRLPAGGDEGGQIPAVEQEQESSSGTAGRSSTSANVRSQIFSVKYSTVRLMLPSSAMSIAAAASRAIVPAVCTPSGTGSAAGSTAAAAARGARTTTGISAVSSASLGAGSGSGRDFGFGWRAPAGAPRRTDSGARGVAFGVTSGASGSPGVKSGRLGVSRSEKSPSGPMGSLPF